MKNFPKKLNSFQSQAWGEKATVKLNNGPTYEEIHLDTNITDASRIEKAVVNMNGDEIIVLTGAELVMLEKYKGQHTEAGLYVIPFSDISCKTMNGIRYTGLVTLPSDNINIEIYLKDNGSSNWGTPSIKAYAYVSQSQPERYFIPNIKKQTMQAGVKGDNEYTTLPAGADKQVRRMHFSYAKIDELTVIRDGGTVYESTKALAEFQAKRWEREPQSGYFHFDPIVSGFALAGLFPTAHMSELKFTVKTTDVTPTIGILVESVRQVKALPEQKV